MKQKWLVLIIIGTFGWLLSGWRSPAAAYSYGAGLYGDCVYGGEVGNAALSFSVGTSSVNLGNFGTSSTGNATATFNAAVKCTDLGYLIKMYGAAPTSGGYTLSALSSATASTTGSEQYGINLVDNAIPNIGANPSGGNGVAASGYGSADQFKYVAGDTIASVGTYSDTTNYTISFIANAAATTPAGQYTGTHNLICIATF